MEFEIEHPHPIHHPTGHTWFDKILPVSALFVSFISIMIALHHSQVMQDLVDQNERLVQANSLPHLSHRINTLNRANGLGQLWFRVTNGGIGPAEVRAVEVLIDGQPVRNYAELLGKFGIRGGQLSTASLTNIMIRPGETVTYFDLNADSTIQRQVSQMMEMAVDDKITVRLCYCSVFEECWKIEQRKQRPQPVDQCPIPQVPYE